MFKKKLAFLLVMLCAFSTSIVAKSVQETEVLYAMQSQDEESRNITVFKVVPIGNTASYSPKSAIYYPKRNEVVVSGDKVPYNVERNPHYGQVNDVKGSFQYRVGDYFTNLIEE